MFDHFLSLLFELFTLRGLNLHHFLDSLSLLNRDLLLDFDLFPEPLDFLFELSSLDLDGFDFFFGGRAWASSTAARTVASVEACLAVLLLLGSFLGLLLLGLLGVFLLLFLFLFLGLGGFLGFLGLFVEFSLSLEFFLWVSLVLGKTRGRVDWSGRSQRLWLGTWTQISELSFLLKQVVELSLSESQLSLNDVLMHSALQNISLGLESLLRNGFSQRLNFVSGRWRSRSTYLHD